MHVHGNVLPWYPPAPADPTLQPADALIRESDPNQSEYSPDTQYERICAAMAQRGYYCAAVDGDVGKGHITTRAGYVRIKARCAQGLTAALFVSDSSRLGRDASERLSLAKALRLLRVPCYSVQQGELKDDLAGGIMALADQEFAKNVSFKVVGAMPSAVRHGSYPARTPIGYRRVWPEGQEYSRRARPAMLEDDEYGPLVREHIFGAYGRQGWSMRGIVRWLNSTEQPLPNPESKKGLWNIGLVGRILRHRVYLGEIEWGRRKTGHYSSYDGPVLRSGEDGCGPAKHKPLIDQALWEEVQMRLANEDPRRVRSTRKARTPALLSGFLRCRGCAGPMRALRERKASTPQYVCGGRERAQADCREPGASMAQADEAVLREVARLRAGRPWTDAALGEISVDDPHAAERAQCHAEIAEKRRLIDANARMLSTLFAVPEPDDAETVASIRRQNQALDREIKSHQAHLAELPAPVVPDAAALEALARQAAQPTLPALIAHAQAAGDPLCLRALLADIVQSATIVERVAGGRNGKTSWVRAEVTWTAPVALLLQYGFLVLEPAAPSPVVLPKAERLRQWRTRRAAERAQAAAIPADLLSVKEAAARLQITEPAVRSAIRRKLVQATRRPEQPGRTFVAVAEVERYRKERLGQVGRTRTPGLAEERERQFQARLDAFRAEHEAARA